MKLLDVKEHNKKYIEFSKKVAKGDFPSRRVAKIGSITGGIIGIILMLIGIIGSFTGLFWAIGSLIAGFITIISNYLNLKRLKL